MTVIREEIRLDDEVLSLEEAARVLRMSPSWVEKSDVPRIRMGRAVRYLKSQLLVYANNRLTHSMTDWQKRKAA